MRKIFTFKNAPFALGCMSDSALAAHLPTDIY